MERLAEEKFPNDAAAASVGVHAGSLTVRSYQVCLLFL